MKISVGKLKKSRLAFTSLILTTLMLSMASPFVQPVYAVTTEKTFNLTITGCEPDDVTGYEVTLEGEGTQTMTGGPPTYTSTFDDLTPDNYDWSITAVGVGEILSGNEDIIGDPNTNDLSFAWPCWPTTEDWQHPPICYCDGDDTNPATSDIVGCPAAFFHFDDTFAYFRERMEGNPSASGGGAPFVQAVWLVLFDLGSDGLWEYLLGINGNNPDQVEFRQNDSPTNPVWEPIINNRDTADTVLDIFPISYARWEADGSTGYYFVDWAIPKAILNTYGITESTGMFFATSTQINTYNKDFLDCYRCPIPDAGTDQTLCEDPSGTTTFSLSGSATAGSGSYSYLWSESYPEVTINSPSSQSTDVYITGTGTFTITLTVTDTNTQCERSDDVELTVIEVCTPYPQDFSICPGTTVDDQLFIDNGVYCDGTCDMTLTYSFDSSIPDDYQYTVTCGEGQCATSDTGTVTVIDCDDDNLCTTDSCNPATGECVNTPIDCDPCYVCNPATGQCEYQCNLCEVCENDECVPKDCDDQNECTTDSCDPATGECVHDPVDCDDGNLCTIDSCDPATGCVNTPIDCDPCYVCNPATGQCEYQCNLCEVCENDECVPKDCDDQNECTTDSCDPATGECVHDPVVCPEGGYEEDGGTYPECDGSLVCTYQDWIWVDYVCDSFTGECVRLPNENDTKTTTIGCTDCDDGNPCNGIETCENGACVPGTPVVCDPCEECNPATGECEYQCDLCQVCENDECVPKDCSDDDLCTTDSCNPATGECVHTPIDCNDDNLCTTDSCNPATGCVNTPIDCDDGDACTIDTCDSVLGCQHEPVDCDDGDACTIDSCDPATGCVNTPNNPSADAGEDEMISSGGSVEIGDDPTGSGGTGSLTFGWSPATGLNNTGVANPIASPTTTTTYTVTVTDANGCIDEDSMVVVVTTPFTPSGSGGPPARRNCYLDIDMLGEIVTIRIDCCNDTTYSSHIIFDPDDEHFLSLDRNTAIICGDCVGCGHYPLLVKITEAEDPPPAPEGMEIIGYYECEGYKRDYLCSHVTFGKPIVLLMSYPPDELPENTSSVVIAWYDAEQGVWVELPPDTGRVAEVGKVTGLLNMFSSFAVFAKLSPPPSPEPPPAPAPPAPPPPPAPPAHFVASNLTIEPSHRLVGIGSPFTFMVRTGENVTITANVGNDGGQQGSYVADLKINGATQATKEIALLPGQNQEVLFTVSDNIPGHHTIQIGDLRGEFETLAWVNWWLIGGLIAAFGLLIWLAWYYGYRRRRR